MSMPLLVNDLFTVSGMTHRLLHVAKDGVNAYAIRMDEKNPMPRHWYVKELTRLSLTKKLRVLPMTEAERPTEAQPSDLVVRDLRWSRIKDIVGNDDVWEAATRGQLLKRHADSIGVSAKSLLACLRRWWLGGQYTDALLGNYYKVGRVDPSADGALAVSRKSSSGESTVVFAPATQTARGRRPKDGDYKPLSLPARLRREVLDIATRHYLADASKSVRGAAVAAVAELFVLRDSTGALTHDERGRPMLKPRGQRPSIRQVQYMLSQAIELTQKHKKRHSKADFDNNHAPASGSVLDDCEGPGDVYEMDPTWADMWIVAKDNRTKIIGKATLYLIIDRYSRLIVGFYISLENPSWEEAKVAILTIGGDWEALHKRLGVPYYPVDWPARGVMPNRFFADRGEMIAYASNVLCDGLQIQVCNAPALFARRKPLVEGGLMTMHVPLKESAPGFEPASNVTKRRGKKYHQDACFNLDELAAFYLRIVAAKNTTIVEGYPTTPDEIMSGFVPTPVNIWNRGIARRTGAATRYPPAVLRRKLLKGGKGRVQVDGVHFENCIYDFPDARQKAWFSNASLTGAFEVSVAYSPDLVNNICVIDPGDKSEHQANLTSDCEIFKNYGFAEVKAIVAERGRIRRAAEDDKFASQVGVHDAITTAGKRATAEVKAATAGKTQASRFHDAGDVRAAEARARRAKVHDMDNDGSPYLATPGVESAEASSEQPATAAVLDLAAARRGVRGTAALAVSEAEPELPDEKGSTGETDPGLVDNLLDLINQT